MRLFPRSRLRRMPVLFAIVLLGTATALAGNPEENQFIAENNAAVAKMMADIDMQPTGDVDADFVAMMVPHHQGAIDMAQAQLRFGRNKQLQRIAQEIIVTQQQEIATMRQALSQSTAPSMLQPNDGVSPSEIEEPPTSQGMNMQRQPSGSKDYSW